MLSLLAAGLLLSPAHTLAFCGSRLPHGHVFPRDLSRRQEEVVEAPKFGYGNADGPLLWHTLNAEFDACKTGTQQSPIILDTGVTETVQDVTLDLPFARDVLFENLGTTAEVVVNATTTIAGEQWELAQFHFHTPSEHRVNGEHADAEVHMVHSAPDGRIAVVSLMVVAESRRTTPALETVIANVADIPALGETTTITELDLTHLSRQLSGGTFFAYSGSLTTPPCSESVTWRIYDTPLALDVRTLRNLRAVTKSNARVTQGGLGTTNLIEVAFSGVPPPAAGGAEGGAPAASELISSGTVGGASTATTETDSGASASVVTTSADTGAITAASETASAGDTSSAVESAIASAANATASASGAETAVLPANAAPSEAVVAAVDVDGSNLLRGLGGHRKARRAFKSWS